MKLILDTHVHLYPEFNLNKFLSYAGNNFAKFSKSYRDDKIFCALCLTESKNCDFYTRLESGALPSDFEIENLQDRLLVKHPQQVFCIFPGFQIITTERIEVLCLGSKQRINDGKDLLNTVISASELGVAVLPWSPGKWLGSRGKKITEILPELTKLDGFLGDISLRAFPWREPKPFKIARKLGIKILTGSDPLPQSGEETQIARYCSVFDAGINETNPAILPLKDMLSFPASIFGSDIFGSDIFSSVSGSRNSPVESLLRQIKLRCL